RCTSLDGLIIRSRIVPSGISTDPLVLAFARREAADELAPLLERAKIEFQHLQLVRTFDLQNLVENIRDHVQYVQGKQLPQIERAVAEMRDMLRHAEELQAVAMKFQNQVNSLLGAGQEEQLAERVRRAIDYFSRSLMEHLFIPLEAHIQSLKGAKKIKQYLKRVR